MMGILGNDEEYALLPGRTKDRYFSQYQVHPGKTKLRCLTETAMLGGSKRSIVRYFRGRGARYLMGKPSLDSND